MHRFLLSEDNINGNTASLSTDEARHALKVLRLSDGDEVEAMDGWGRAWKGTLSVNGREVGIILSEMLPSTEAPVSLTVYMGLVKGEKLELIAQKLTEIGVIRLVPVRMERSVMQVSAAEAAKKLERPRRIAREALKQCGRTREMEIPDPIDFQTLAERVSGHRKCFVFWENARDMRLLDVFRQQPELNDLACVIGPEGGISEKEMETLINAGACALTLGRRILRAETAAIAASAEILALWGDM
ncbi:MAG: 16S rRNA (uracil(1498)-N(3))-methyltransferase [Clostridiales bacterium]|nr:16S rRNA (uracil(1498)-N(3))-methyltransferase [Clostridiales bacterium]